MPSKNRTRFGIAMPQKFPDGKVDTRYIGDFLSRVEALGYDSVWVGEGHFSPIPNLEPIPLLSYAAALTTRVKIGVSALLSAFWSPVHLAKGLATLDQLSDGRLIPAVTIGPHLELYPAFGMEGRNRVSRFEEGLSLMKALWTQDRVTFHGRYWNMDNVSINPRPRQTPHLPLWFGARVEPALRRAVKVGDGWMGSGATSTEEFKEHLKLVRRFLREVEKDPAMFSVSKRVYMALDPNKERALRRLEEMMGNIYGDPSLAAKVSVYGGEEEVVDGLGKIMEDGIDLLLLAPAFDPTDQAERLAEDVLPKL